MRKPVPDLAADLRRQRLPGRSPETAVAEPLRPGGPSMTVPGTGRVEAPPGAVAPRSAARYCGPQRRFGG